MGFLTEHHYQALHRFISRKYGIQYGREKKNILLGRVEKVMRLSRISDPDFFVQAVTNGRYPELSQDFINMITVNKTDFFREKQHFDYLIQNSESILKNNPAILETGEIRVWSAASSTGEEPYTLAMVLKEVFGDRLKIRVLATDIDTNVLAAAQEGVYRPSVLKDMPRAYFLRYFTSDGELYRVNQEIRDMVSFRSFNLMNPFPFHHRFDIVFCRNVMIYFNQETQTELIRKIHASLNTGGLMFIGHSEALIDKSIPFKYIKPAIYMRQ
jgi:chemotaxis protein methyltransferase CheR